jgi:hypothetical protein
VNPYLKFKKLSQSISKMDVKYKKKTKILIKIKKEINKLKISHLYTLRQKLLITSKNRLKKVIESL